MRFEWERSARNRGERERHFYVYGVKMENYLAWMKSAYYITATGNPAVSVPCAFSKRGLPIGIQIVGRNLDDWGVLQMAFAFEQARNLEKRKPVCPLSGEV